MNLIGQKVRHIKYGIGTVLEMNDAGNFTVEFEEKTARFQYPAAFEKSLTAEDEGLQEEITADLRAKNKAAEEEKAARDAQRMELIKQSRAVYDTGGYSDKKYVPTERTEGKALTFFVFQGGIFDEQARR